MQLNTDDVLAAMGYRPGVRLVDVVFMNPSIDTATVPETVAPIGGLVALRAEAAAVEIVSSSALDTSGGSGAWTVQINGLDAEYREVQETLPVLGVAPSVGAVPFLRVNEFRVIAAGAGKANAGIITLRDVGAGTARSMIQAGESRAEVGVFTVPAGHKMLATGWTVSARDAVGNKALADVAFYTTLNGVRFIDWRLSFEGTVATDIGSPHIFEERADIEVVVTRVNTNATFVALHGHGLLIGPHSGM